MEDNMIFEKSGPQNTDSAINIAIREAEKRGIKNILAASTYGDTAEKIAEKIKGKNLNLIIVTHNTGFKNKGEQQFDVKIKEKIEKAGVKILTGTMALRGLGRAVKEICGYSQEDLVGNALRMFCQGAKVCAEMAAMAVDAGIIPPCDVIAVAGTGRGADTVILMKAESSNKFFDIKFKEILAKPLEF